MSHGFWYCSCRHPNTKVYYADECDRLSAELENEVKAKLAYASTAMARIRELESALREIADLPEEYVSGRYAHEWLLSNPAKHAVTYSLIEKARKALGL